MVARNDEAGSMMGNVFKKFFFISFFLLMCSSSSTCLAIHSQVGRRVTAISGRQKQVVCKCKNNYDIDLIKPSLSLPFYLSFSLFLSLLSKHTFLRYQITHKYNHNLSSKTKLFQGQVNATSIHIRTTTHPPSRTRSTQFFSILLLLGTQTIAI